MMGTSKKPAEGAKPHAVLHVEPTPEETGAQALARKLLQPTLKNAAAASAFTDKMMGNSSELPSICDYADHVHAATHDAADGDLGMASKILAAQAITLDSMFAELALRAALNMGEYINAAEKYGRLALKAQSNCRATLEALAKLHQPREQTVRHVHVNEGAQAVIAEQFHHHAGARKNAEIDDQSHATAAGSVGGCPPLLGTDPLRNGVPVPSRERKAAVPHARRDQSGRA